MAEAYLYVITERENRILDYLKKERTLPEMIRQWLIYGKPKEPQNMFEFAEETMLRHHLAYAIQKGRIHQSGDKYVAV